jgi:hypothetical protein
MREYPTLLPWQRDIAARLEAGQQIHIGAPRYQGRAAMVAQLELIAGVMFGQYARIYWRENLLELTTGEGVEPVRCACWITASRPFEAPAEWEQNPDCPLHWAPSRMAPCSCKYFHERTRMVIHEGRSPQSIFLVVGTGFLIDPWCPHHGSPDEFDRMTPAQQVLGEDEWRGY